MRNAGSCLCGAVSYSVNGPLREVVYCHCGQCRKQTGLFYAASNAMNEDIAITGEDNLTWYRSSETGRRGFCRTCGSALFWKNEGADHLSIMAGSFDQGTPLVAGYHISARTRAISTKSRMVCRNLPGHDLDPGRFAGTDCREAPVRA